MCVIACLASRLVFKCLPSDGKESTEDSDDGSDDEDEDEDDSDHSVEPSLLDGVGPDAKSSPSPSPPEQSKGKTKSVLSE
jgi:hypothetical protein